MTQLGNAPDTRNLKWKVQLKRRHVLLSFRFFYQPLGRFPRNLPAYRTMISVDAVVNEIEATTLEVAPDPYVD